VTRGSGQPGLFGFVGLEQVVKNGATVLQRELKEVRDQIVALERTLEEKPDYGLGQGAPAVTRWELDHALLERLRERAASLEQALSGVSEGTYGICERCGGTIHPDRLAVLPDTRICVNCARAGESE
jgi:DnaK suppressor protein